MSRQSRKFSKIAKLQLCSILKTDQSLRPNSTYKQLFFFTWYGASILPVQLGKLKRMPTTCYKPTVGLCVCVQQIYTHCWVGHLYVVMKCSGAKRTYQALRCKSWQLKWGKWLEAPGHSVNISERKQGS